MTEKEVKTMERTSKVQELIDVREAARLLDVRPHQIYRLVETGRLPHYKIGRYVKLSLDEVLRFCRRGPSGGGDNEQN
ncbi:MAG: helix-turn-helix domain-containing protein [Actinomycetota bacterium]